MSDKTMTGQTELRKYVEVAGVSLGIVAKKIEENEWELSVENAVGARSVWIETFPTAQTALKAGVDAIESEGVESFSG